MCWHYNILLAEEPTIEKDTTKALEDWLADHKDYPYPTKQEFRDLAREAGMTNKQVRVWFTNYRYVGLY